MHETFSSQYIRNTVTPTFRWIGMADKSSGDFSASSDLLHAHAISLLRSDFCCASLARFTILRRVVICHVHAISNIWWNPFRKRAVRCLFKRKRIYSVQDYKILEHYGKSTRELDIWHRMNISGKGKKKQNPKIFKRFCVRLDLIQSVFSSEIPSFALRTWEGRRCILVITFRCITLMAHAVSLTEAFISNGYLVKPRLFACSNKCRERRSFPSACASWSRSRR